MAEKPSVLVLIPSFQPSHEGRYLEEICENYFALAGSFDITAAALIVPNVTSAFDLEDIHVLTLGKGTTERMGAMDMLRWMRLLMREHSARQFQFIHSVWATYPSFMGSILSRVFRIPLIVTVAGSECISMPQLHYGGAGNVLARLRLRWVLRRASAILVGSEFQKKNVIGFYPDVEKKIALAPFGIARKNFPFCLRLSPEKEIILLAVGWLNPVKNYPLLLRAFALVHEKYPQTVLRIAGNGTEEKQLENLANELGISEAVSFLGRIAHTQLVEQYHSAHLFLHTAAFESQCIAITEALSTGLPVVSTAVGLAPEILSGKNGISVNFFEPEGVAQEVSQMITRICSPEYEAIQHAASNSAEWFDIARTVTLFKGIYNSVLTNKHPS